MPVSLQSSATAIDIGLVNNMPDSALAATDRQFRSLLEEASGDFAVRLTSYSLPGVSRGEAGLRQIREYAGIDELWDRRLDGLIVTGAEPHADDLREEPYWKSLTRLLDWAERRTTSAIWSCLAAHAAVLHNDGIRRRRLTEKRFGIFESHRVFDHELMSGTDPTSSMPHSRWNDLAEDDLRSAGYKVLARSEKAGVDTFVREGNSLHLFFQGHPEYARDTLFLEYRRDIKRFLRRELAVYPSAPQGYFDDEALHAWAEFKERALQDRNEALAVDFPTLPPAVAVKDMWRPHAICTYRNWLAYLVEEKRRRTGAKSLVGTAE